MIVFKDPPGGTCEIKGLQSYTNHTCTVQPKYNNNLEGTSAEVRQKTETGSKCENLLEEITTTHVSYKQTILTVYSFILCVSHSVEVFTFVTVCLSNVLQYRKSCVFRESLRVLQCFSGLNCNQLQ